MESLSSHKRCKPVSGVNSDGFVNGLVIDAYCSAAPIISSKLIHLFIMKVTTIHKLKSNIILSFIGPSRLYFLPVALKEGNEGQSSCDAQLDC